MKNFEPIGGKNKIQSIHANFNDLYQKPNSYLKGLMAGTTQCCCYSQVISFW